MRCYLMISLLIIFFSCKSQSSKTIDKVIFNKISNYRISKGLKPWIWSDKAWSPANFHSNYMSSNGEMEHHQNTFDTKKGADRLTYFNIDWNYSGENICVLDGKDLSYEQIADRALELWIESPPHHKLLLKEDGVVSYGAISCVTGNKYKWSNNYPYWKYITLTLVGE